MNNKYGVVKPHIYIQWYPKSNRFYWRSTGLAEAFTKPYYLANYDFWVKSNKFVARLNDNESLRLIENDTRSNCKKR